VSAHSGGVIYNFAESRPLAVDADDATVAKVTQMIMQLQKRIIWRKGDGRCCCLRISIVLLHQPL